MTARRARTRDREVIAPTTQDERSYVRSRKGVKRRRARPGHWIGARPAPNAVKIRVRSRIADVDLREIADRAIALAETRRSAATAPGMRPGREVVAGGVAHRPEIEQRHALGQLRQRVLDPGQDRRLRAGRWSRRSRAPYVAVDARLQRARERRVLDHQRAFGVVVVAARIEVVAADHADAAVDHHRFRVQAAAGAAAGQRRARSFTPAGVAQRQNTRASSGVGRRPPPTLPSCRSSEPSPAVASQHHLPRRAACRPLPASVRPAETA